MWPWSGRTAVVVAATMVAPVSATTTWRVVPWTTSFAVGDTSDSGAGEERRAALAVEPGAAADCGTAGCDAAPSDAGVPDGPVVHPPRTIAVMTESARSPAREQCPMLVLICRGAARARPAKVATIPPPGARPGSLDGHVEPRRERVAVRRRSGDGDGVRAGRQRRVGHEMARLEL